MKISDEEERLLKILVDHFDEEDREIREAQIMQWKRLKLFWDGFSHAWFSEVAHDWRVYTPSENDDQAYYDKTINIYQAYLSSIIAALSTAIPPIKCYPDDADNSLDLQTAKASDKIAQLIARHNNVNLLWVQGLFIYCTEGLVACYNYSKEDKSYGVTKEPQYEERSEEIEVSTCSNCGAEFGEDSIQCENCGAPVETAAITKQIITNTHLVGITENPKSRQCMEVYGGLFVKVSNYAREQKDCLYLTFSYETHYANARARYGAIRDKIHENSRGSEYYEKWGRLSTQYQSNQPRNTCTIRCTWLRPNAYEILDDADSRKLRKKFPNGVRVDFVDDVFAEVSNEELDKHWTLTKNPLTDYIHHQPLGTLLTAPQEITGDIISLVLQTIEHGIPQTFADPGVVNFPQYASTEVKPGSIFPATPKSGKTMNDAFHEVRTASLSQEILPFFQMIQSMAQVASGALPSLFGGQQEGSKTASEYGMSRNQALQRLQNTWKIFNVWWKEIFGKVIPAYIEDMTDDEKFVEKDQFGSFVNVFIRQAELQGKLGNIELDASENLPMTWMQQKDAFMELFQLNNPQILQLLMSPENLPKFSEFIGVQDIYMPGTNDREKQYEEIVQLMESEPIPMPVDEMAMREAQMQGQPPPEPQEMPSIEIDPIIDNHQIEFEICRTWLVSSAGRLAKVEKPRGYQNVLLHAQAHYQVLTQQTAMQQQAGQVPQEEGAPQEMAQQ